MRHYLLQTRRLEEKDNQLFLLIVLLRVISKIGFEEMTISTKASLKIRAQTVDTTSMQFIPSARNINLHILIVKEIL